MTGTFRFLLEKLFLDFLAFYQRPGSETAKLKDHIRLLNKDVVTFKKMSAINRLLTDDRVRTSFWADIGLPLA